MKKATKEIQNKNWEVKSLRVTSFLVPSAKLNEVNWWEQITGEPPETKISKPKLGGLEEIGPYNNGKLSLHIQPARIDWHFSIGELKEEQIGQDLSLGLFNNVLPQFKKIFMKWISLPDCPESVRLAFGAILTIPTNSHKSGYELLNSFLPNVEIDSENSRDFFFQINRPRKSSVIADLEINRLCKWSVMRFAWHLYSPANIVVDQTDSYSCQLELDISTSAMNQSCFLGDQIPKIFDELVDLGKEISEKGDIL